MIDKTFIEKILEISSVEKFEIGGRQFTDKRVYPVNDAEVAPITCHTLTGLIDFYCSLPSDDQARVMFHVQDYNKVSIVSEIFGTEKQRETFITAQAYPQKENFGTFIGHEEFMISILSMFVQDEITAKILRIVGNLKSEAGATYSDDGLTQTVTAKTGITKVENIDLPNPITLRPYRTFADIQQPESSFILRLKQHDGGVKAALFEADGAAWKNTAIANIKKYIQRQDLGVNIIA